VLRIRQLQEIHRVLAQVVLVLLVLVLSQQQQLAVLVV
jgi:hypothetical protein